MPRELEDGALALGTTRWEMVRGVILPGDAVGSRRGDDSRARARAGRGDRGDAGDRRRHAHRPVALPAGDTLASKIASSYQGAGSGLEISSLLYLAAILLVLGLIANLAAQVIVRRFDPMRGAR